MNYLQFILHQLGLRMDAKFTAALDLQLEHLKTATYDILYPELKARKLLPVDMDVDPGAETVAYLQWDEYGMAQIIANFADDLTMVETLAEKFFTPVHSLGKGYQYSIQDLRRSAMAGISLDTRRGMVARHAIERAIDEIASVGDPKAKLVGFLNNVNVTILTAATDGTSTRWVGGRTTPKAPDLIKADMHAAVSEIWTTTKQVHSPDTIVLSAAEYGHISQTSVSALSEVTILKSFLANNPYISNVDFWYKLDLADAAGTGPRMVTYKRSPEILELIIPQDFEQFPPQARNLAFVIPCHARIGGVVMRYPLAVAYTDGI